MQCRYSIRLLFYCNLDLLFVIQEGGGGIEDEGREVELPGFPDDVHDVLAGLADAGELNGYICPEVNDSGLLWEDVSMICSTV